MSMVELLLTEIDEKITSFVQTSYTLWSNKFFNCHMPEQCNTLAILTY